MLHLFKVEAINSKQLSDKIQNCYKVVDNPEMVDGAEHEQKRKFGSFLALSDLDKVGWSQCGGTPGAWGQYHSGGQV